ncbi:conjugal transfer protein TraV [Altererythrobacter sp. B11]|uniref:TraV family lipoprotein n=1 Tax=Altererythrobacter sp. B11 TaxID=2060312 RepID=UPI000DC71E6B|nr:TraV family lipoprotein [Altererythrobacter sp. B11]BBC73244.1 conjugal transfer protein TraV [Altererythrobacter sp. B11]
MSKPAYQALHRSLLSLSLVASLGGCATVGSIMSPYSEKFDCKNSDHGQCIHPDRAYEDAVAGVASKSDPKVTNDRAMLRGQDLDKANGRPGGNAAVSAYGSYRDSVYQELKGLIEAPVTPMLKPARTVRTLILPYADRERPDRLYMPRYVYSVIDKPVWVVGGALVASPDRASQAPILGQVRDGAAPDGETAQVATVPAAPAIVAPAPKPQP